MGRWVSTSGLGAFQDVGDWSKQGGGVIPATYQCNPSFDNYWVEVEPIDLSYVKGVEGMAYRISRSSKNQGRQDERRSTHP